MFLTGANFQHGMLSNMGCFPRGMLSSMGCFSKKEGHLNQHNHLVVFVLCLTYPATLFTWILINSCSYEKDGGLIKIAHVLSTKAFTSQELC